MGTWTALLLLGIGLPLAPPCGAGEPCAVTTRSLLGEMADLDRLAEFPAPRFTCRQFSSYDRASRSPGENWFANNDRGQYLRTEEREGRKEYVMMDALGPGAIVRIWSANPSGVLRVYLDGRDRPALEVPMADFLGGKLPGFPDPIAGVRARGWSSYFPIAYARRCKVTSDQGDFYYHVDYRTYPETTRVESFRNEAMEGLAPAVAAAARALRAGGAGGDRGETRRIASLDRSLAPGAVAARRLPGGGAGGGHAVREIEMSLDAPDLPRALRQTLLLMRFDGERTVESPVGDFFGAAPGINPYRTLPMEVEAGGRMRCRFVMPYEEQCALLVQNRGDQGVRVRARIATTARPWTPRSMHFHARWHAESQVPTRPMRDWSYLDAEGKGVFVGAALSIANPVKAWWGEGDEKIYVDGERFPSLFGTGTEDYFGYAWCSGELFSHPYHAQARSDGPGSYGHTAVNRWHVLDRIPFRRGIRFDMGLWHWDPHCKVDLGVTAYWYARPGGKANLPPIRPEDLVLHPLGPYEPPRVAGAIEGEGMRILEKDGSALPQEIGGCSGEAHLWWQGGQKPGDHLVLGFSVERAGRYRVLARFVEAADYGIHQLSVNEEPAGEPRNFYHDGVIVSEEIELGVFGLRAGENRLSVEVVGTDPRAVPRYMFGLDYLRVEPAGP